MGVKDDEAAGRVVVVFGGGRHGNRAGGTPYFLITLSYFRMVVRAVSDVVEMEIQCEAAVRAERMRCR